MNFHNSSKKLTVVGKKMSLRGEGNSAGMPPDQICKQSWVMNLSLCKHWYCLSPVLNDPIPITDSKASTTLCIPAFIITVNKTRHSAKWQSIVKLIVIFKPFMLSIVMLNAGNTEGGEVSLYWWLPVWLVWNQLYDNRQSLFLFAKQTDPNQSNRRSTLQCYFPL